MDPQKQQSIQDLSTKHVEKIGALRTKQDELVEHFFETIDTAKVQAIKNNIHHG